MTAHGGWRGVAGRVVVVAAGTVLLLSLWQKATVRPPVEPLREAQAEMFLSRSQRPLVFPGEYRDTVVFFLDYRCGYCAVAYLELVRPDANYGVEVRHFVAGPNSVSAQAALAAECARNLGEFHAYGYSLFARRDSIGLASWQSYAAVAGIRDPARLTECIDRRATVAVVQGDSELAQQLAISGTPAAIHRGRVYLGSLGMVEMLRELGGARQQ